MLHTFKLYRNTGDRKLPVEMVSSTIELDCINPGNPTYSRLYSTDRLFRHLQDEHDLSYHGLYLTVYPTVEPTCEGKRWFVRAPMGNGRSDDIERELRWINKNDLKFWDTSFRIYTEIYQGRGIIEYSLYVSRCFGYTFLVGQAYQDEDSDDLSEFINFYPTLHHYHMNVMVDERNLWRPPNDDYIWRPFDYPMVDDEDYEDEVRPDNVSVSFDELVSLDFADVLAPDELDELEED